MNIQEITEKFKGLLSNTEYLLTILIVCVSLSSFWLGRLSVGENQAMDTEQPATVIESNAKNTTSVESVDSKTFLNEAKSDIAAKGAYVASKSGTKYHLPWCGSAKQIKEENKVWFATKEEAEKAGYTPASNCKGI